MRKKFHQESQNAGIEIQLLKLLLDLKTNR